MTEQAPPSELIERLQRNKRVRSRMYADGEKTGMLWSKAESDVASLLAALEQLQERVAEVEKALREAYEIPADLEEKFKEAIDKETDESTRHFLRAKWGTAGYIAEKIRAEALATLSKEGS